MTKAHFKPLRGVILLLPRPLINSCYSVGSVALSRKHAELSFQRSGGGLVLDWLSQYSVSLCVNRCLTCWNRWQSAVKVSSVQIVNRALEDSSIPATIKERWATSKLCSNPSFNWHVLICFLLCSALTVSMATAHAAVAQHSRADTATSARIHPSTERTAMKVTAALHRHRNSSSVCSLNTSMRAMPTRFRL